jgi:hypothetical protein
MIDARAGYGLIGYGRDQVMGTAFLGGADIIPKNRHRELEWGPPVGKEVLPAIWSGPISIPC